MIYRNLRACVDDLHSAGHLMRIDDPVDARLEAAEIHRRVFASGGPALLFANLVNCRFPMVSNLFGSIERTRFIFRDTLDSVRHMVELKVNPALLSRQFWKYGRAALNARFMLTKTCHRGPVIANETTISDLPQLVSWPNDGGPFITLPLVYSEDPDRPGAQHSNLGMYRVQLGGNTYQTNNEIGLHYQIHRGIGVHHAAAVRRGEPLKVNIFVGGTPAMTLAAVMPLPEGLSELGFAGALAGHRIPMLRRPASLPIYAEADFCITGTIDTNKMSPEGPFGDHLGYYSLVHDFPVLRVDKVFHRPNAIWPFTVVGRPPQEDTMFGELIHEITGPVIPTVVPGVSAVHAVDAAGVHPLMLAIGSERYTPYAPVRQPQELLTQANAILGQGQMSLAKYLLIVNQGDDRTLKITDIDHFFRHLLQRICWDRDLHFHTRTTIDTLDYSGTRINEGSKVVMAAAGPILHELATEIPNDLRLPDGFSSPVIALPGVLVVEAREYNEAPDDPMSLRSFCATYSARDSINRFRMIVLTDNSRFLEHQLSNFLWVTFTRSNPAADIDGVDPFIEAKHWGCRGAIVIDARPKPHHAPKLESDQEIVRRVDARASRGGPLAKWL